MIFVKDSASRHCKNIFLLMHLVWSLVYHVVCMAGGREGYFQNQANKALLLIKGYWASS